MLFRSGQPVYRVGAPFGDEMILVVASASPLFAELPDSTTDREYLTSFRRAFLVRPQSGGGQRTVGAVATALKTRERN